MSPVINKLKKKPKSTIHKETDMRELRKKAYNNTAWRKLRETHLKSNPLCTDCLSKGKVTPAEDIHHIKSPFKGGKINYALLLDDNNLVSLCKPCHALRHNKEQGYVSPEEVIKQLEDLFNDNIPDSNLE